MPNKAFTSLIGALLGLAVFALAAGPAAAVTDVFLRAEAVTMNFPNGLGGTNAVPMWGFAQDTAFGAGDGGPASVPGPVLKVPPGETVLRIHLDNNLAEPISIHVNGLIGTNGGPVFSEMGDGAVYSSARPAGNFTARARSFAQETPPGNSTPVIYQFNLRPGTYLYSSGTNPAKQVQMGLYGALAVDAATGQAYAGVAYTRDVVLLYSEVDPAIHAAVALGTYGPGGTITSSVNREPRYFLINGMAYDPTGPNGGGLDPVAFVDFYDKVLLRVLNAGYETHAPTMLNAQMKVVAEDGNPFNYAQEQYGFELPAGKTIDAVLTPAAPGKYSIHDATLHLTNDGAAAPGGMLAYLGVGCAGDLDQNGIINFADLALLRASFGTTCTPGTPCPGDINKDGSVNFVDMNLLRASFGASGCPIP